MIVRTPSQRQATLLDSVKTIAVVGASPNPLRPSYTRFLVSAHANAVRT